MNVKRMKPMRYELYADSLFLINFVMNLYVLMLVNRSTHGTATPLRLLAASALGGAGYLLLLWLPGTAAVKLLAGTPAGVVGMLLIAFRVKGLRNFMRLLEKTLIDSFCMGGALLFVLRSFRLTERSMTGLFGILGIGGILYLFLGHSFREPGEAENVCRATLKAGAEQITVTALIDSGNSLVEPVSGKPVSVVEEQVFRRLWGDGEQLYRAVPFHSIGKKRGILKGYLLPELRLELRGMEKGFQDVYIAVSPEAISSSGEQGQEPVRMIVNPRLLEGKQRERKRKQKERRHDIESGNAGKNAVQDDTQGEPDLPQEGRNPLHRGYRDPAAALGGGQGEPGHK